MTVFKEKIIPARIEEVWRHLTDAALLTEWFADTDGLKPQGEFVFSFGDGDFFSGHVVEWDAPEFLQIRWKFMGVGPSFNIQYSLRSLGESTRLNVRDEGALTEEEADGLREGWEDFLTRLEGRIRTGQPTRYQWSETINATVSVGKGFSKKTSVAKNAFHDDAWWRSNFPQAHASLETEGDNALRFNVRDEAWNGVATTVKITLRQLEGGAYAEVNHAGWTALPAGRQLAERRRYAQLWTQALRQLEQDAGQG